MGNTSTPAAPLQAAVVTKSGHSHVSRFAAVVLVIIALVTAAFMIGRITVGSSSAPGTLTPAQHGGTSLQSDACRPGRPC